MSLTVWLVPWVTAELRSTSIWLDCCALSVRVSVWPLEVLKQKITAVQSVRPPVQVAAVPVPDEMDVTNVYVAAAGTAAKQLCPLLGTIKNWL